jgi:epoxyqueuosine reductase
MLINKKTGSFFFLGALVIDAESGYDMPFEKDYCGNCRRCIEACPTGAINEDKTIDSNKCISYLTIEHKGDMGEIYHGKTQGRVFGCDICQEVCPWNRKAPVTKIDEFAPLPEILNFSIQQWREITEEEFNEIFKNSPLLRTGYHNFKRNLLLSFGE